VFVAGMSLKNYSDIREEDVELLTRDLDYDDGLSTDIHVRWNQPRSWNTAWSRNIVSHASLLAICDYTLSCLVNLLPSFLAKRWLPSIKVRLLPPLKVHATSWLDGLRGAASLAVLGYHWSRFVLGDVDVVYGQREELNSPLRLPIIRLSFAGLANVAVFFVISGYALSVRPIQLMADPKANAATFGVSFSSSVFRRFFRLYLPAWASTVPTLLWLCFGLQFKLNTVYKELFVVSGAYKKAVEDLHSPIYDHTMAALSQPIIERALFDSASWTQLKLQLAHWLNANFDSTTILEGSWQTDRYQNPYNGNIWTIPVEYRASLFLFLVQIAVCRFRPLYRLIITATLIAYSYYFMRWEMILFLAGFLIAQLDPMLVILEGRMQNKVIKTVYSGFMVMLLLLGLYIASYPPYDAEHAPGFVWLANHVPSFYAWKPWYWFSNGAILAVFAMSRIQSVKAIFCTSIMQYFGHISFAVYLVHLLIAYQFGTIFLYFLLNLTNNLDRHNYPLFTFCFSLSTMYVYALVIWASDVWYRFIDIPSVEFAKWLERKLMM
jgi:peptidoglycan/LPS O-acetylase OafA/YrhL